jgi:hypothetical protein
MSWITPDRACFAMTRSGPFIVLIYGIKIIFHSKSNDTVSNSLAAVVVQTTLQLVGTELRASFTETFFLCHKIDNPHPRSSPTPF